MIIAEIGQNFLGEMVIAKLLIKQAKEGGADLAKFQLYDTDNDFPFTEHVKGSMIYELGKEAELSFEQANELFCYGQEVGIEVFFSVFNVERVKWCEEIGVKRYKVAYSKRLDKPLMKLLITKGKLIYISLGFAIGGMGEGQQLHYLFCIPQYPAPIGALHFSEGDFTERYRGFSDHTIGLDASKIALARGAEIIEKHFALDHQTGVDAPWSMDYEELKELKRWENVCKEVLC